MKRRIRGFFDSTLQTEVAESLKEELKDEDFERVTIEFLKKLERKIGELTLRLRGITERVKAECRRRTGFYICVEHDKCNAGMNCLICLNKYPLHYPRFVQVPKWSLRIAFPPTKKLEFPVKKEDEPNLLLFCGFSEEKVDEFYSMKEMRHNLIKLYHYIILCLSHFGLLPETFKWTLIGEQKKKKRTYNVCRYHPELPKLPQNYKGSTEEPLSPEQRQARLTQMLEETPERLRKLLPKEVKTRIQEES